MGLDDVLFEDREKRYGAYILRKEYARFLLFGFLLMTALFLLGTVGPLLFQKYVADKQEKDPTEIDVSLSDLPPPPPPDEDTPPPPPPPPPKQETPPPPPPPVETKAYLPPKPTPKEEMKEPDKTIANIDSVKTAVVSNKDQKGEKQENANAFVPQVTDPNGKGKAEPAPIKEPEPEPKPEPKPAPEPEPDPNKFIPAQKKPEPVNMDDIKKEIGYPALAREGNIEGDVTLKILVDENGNYVKHNVLKQVHPILLKEVEKHVGKLKFTPAIQGNKPIKFWLVVPFKFKLQG